MINLAVIFGGKNVEHEVSIISAVQAMEHLNKDKYNIIPIYISKDEEWYTGECLLNIDSYKDFAKLKNEATKCYIIKDKNKFYLKGKKILNFLKKEIDIVLPIVHGTNVEDGILQGYLQTIGIPYCFSNVCASSIAQDKVIQKMIFDKENILTPNYFYFYDVEYYNDKDTYLRKAKELKYPVIIKPATLGSSVGINIANNEDELQKYIEEAIKYDKKILVEKVISNLKELNISVLGNYESQECSFIDEIINESKFFTYEEKYLSNNKNKTEFKGKNTSTRKIPADISEELKSEVENTAKRAFKAIGSSGLIRIDFLYDTKSNKLYLNEVNNIPGSLAFYLWEPKGKKYTELLDEIIKIGIKEQRNNSSKQFNFETNILSNFNGSKFKKEQKSK